MLNQPAINPSSNHRNSAKAARATRDVRQRAAANHFETAVDISKFNIKLYKFNIELRRSHMADLEVGGLHRTSSITKDAAKNAEFDAGVLGMGLLYRSVSFDDSSMYQLTYAGGVSRTGATRKGRPKRNWWRCAPSEGVSQRKALCSSAAGHTFRKRGSK